MIIKNFYWIGKDWLWEDSKLEKIFDHTDIDYINNNFTEDDKEYIKSMQWDWLNELWKWLENDRKPKKWPHWWNNRLYVHFDWLKRTVKQISNMTWLKIQQIHRLIRKVNEKNSLDYLIKEKLWN